MRNFLFAILLASAAAALPTTMIAVRKHNSILPCMTPFSCVQTFNAPVPTPGDGQLLVHVRSTSINPCDVDYLEFDVGCSGAGGTLGMDLSGTVAALGPNSSGRIKVGDQIWADLGGLKGDMGAMAEYALVSEQQTGLSPTSGANSTEAGTVPLVGLTALELLQKAMANLTLPKDNLTVVVTSGSGGTGFMLLQLAKHAYNAVEVITSSSEANIEFCKSMGADNVVDYHKAGVFDGLADDSVDLVIDNHGGKGVADIALRTIRAGGVYILLPGGGGGSLSKKGKKDVTQINYGLTTSSDHAGLDSLKDLFEQHKLRPHVFHSFTLKTASQAFALSKAGHVVGKVAVVNEHW